MGKLFYKDFTYIHNITIRYKSDGMGRRLSNIQNRGFMDTRREVSSYQLPRTESNNSGSPILLKDSTIKHVLVQMDKKTAVAYVNKMGELFQKFFQTKPPFFGIGA